MKKVGELNARARVIVALDVPDLAGAKDLLDRLGGVPRFYKIGLELFIAAGAAAVAEVQRRGGRVFLDLKLHDIPETVARAVRSARALGVELLTVHAAGGRDMVARAVEAAGEGLAILAVTVLTSLGEEELAADGIVGGTGAAVRRRAELAIAAGAAGLVCSAQEVAALRSLLPHACLVVPGIRSPGAVTNDQKRVGTPTEAVRAGADYLVVGRPIRDAADPAAAFLSIVRDLEGGR